MTATSGVPYGTPQHPIQPHQQQNQSIQGNPFHNYSSDAIASYANGHALPTLVFSTNDQPTRGTQPGPQTPHSKFFFPNLFLLIILYWTHRECLAKNKVDSI